MSNDDESVRKALEAQSRVRKYRMSEVPGYRAWSQRRLDEGALFDVMMYLDSFSMWLTPEDLAKGREEEFEELFQELREDIGDVD